ncbi:cupin domain-containing protein [Paenibacillus wenxiniae]|uniref:Cupin domain-containing protein n=1 Tax=Paenibacillus wenxiniae TaxID=1636843 RepID=A0ABW4RLF9_9BACL
MKIESLHQHQHYDTARFTKRIVFQHTGNNVFVLNFEPGQQLPAHRHPGSDLYLLMVSGKGTLTIDQQEVGLHTGDMMHVEADEWMSYRGDEKESSSLYVVLVS